jgi:hypothetical protein
VKENQIIYLNSEGERNENQITKHQHETQSFSNNVPPGKGNEGNQKKGKLISTEFYNSLRRSNIYMQTYYSHPYLPLN